MSADAPCRHPTSKAAFVAHVKAVGKAAFSRSSRALEAHQLVTHSLCGAYRALALDNLHDATDKVVVHLFFQRAWHDHIAACQKRIQDASNDLQRDQARKHMQEVLLSGIVFYKTLVVQLQHRFGDVAAELVFDDAARAAAVRDAGERQHGQDCTALVSACLMKLGDLTRYLSKLSGDAGNVRDVLAIAAAHYRQALLLDAGNGQLHNQLGTLAELRGDLLAALLHFALASASAAPFRHADVNWIKVLAATRQEVASLASRRGSLDNLLRGNPSVDTVQKVTSLLVGCVFGTAVDALDLDKVPERWVAASAAVEALLDHPLAVGASRERPGVDCIQDVVLQLALYACLASWKADSLAASSPDDQRTRTAAVAGRMRARLLQLATLYVRSCTARVQALRTAPAPVAAEHAADAARRLACLRMFITRTTCALRGDAAQPPDEDASGVRELMCALSALLDAVPDACLRDWHRANTDLVACDPAGCHIGAADQPEDVLAAGCAAFEPGGPALGLGGAVPRAGTRVDAASSREASALDEILVLPQRNVLLVAHSSCDMLAAASALQGVGDACAVLKQAACCLSARYLAMTPGDAAELDLIENDDSDVDDVIYRPSTL